MIKCLPIVFFVCLWTNLNSQPLSGAATVNHYSIAQKQLLVRSTANFINLITQDNLDRDSVMLIALWITGLPFLIPYTDNFDSELSFVGADLVNAGKITEATQLLK